MATPKVIAFFETTLAGAITSDATSFNLTSAEDKEGVSLATDTYGFVIDEGSSNEEIVIATCTGTACTDVKRGVSVSDGDTEVASLKKAHRRGASVKITDAPLMMLLASKEYVDSVAIAGVADASATGKGAVEVAVQSEIDADTRLGSTGAVLAVAPDVLATSKYGVLISSFTGVILPYGAPTAPTGFLLCDGTAYDIADYNALALVIKNYHGQNAGSAVTADAGTDFLTATSHGLEDGDHIFLTNIGGALPAGLAVNTSYYVRDKTTNTFKVTATVGGTAVDITGAGTGTHYFHTQIKVPDLRGSFIMGQGTRVRTMTFDGASAVDPATDIITVESNDWLHTGQAVALTGSALPTGLTAGTYYVIRVNATSIKLAANVSNANAGTAVNITADGSGTCTLTQTLTARTIGQNGGEETHALTDAEMPSHNHTLIDTYVGSGGTTNNVVQGETIGSSWTTGYNKIGFTGSDTPHNTIPPYTVLGYIIKH